MLAFIKGIVTRILRMPLFRIMRSGDWLTSSRLRVYPALVGCGLASTLAALVLTSHGIFDYWNRPLGTDFSGVYVAGQAVLAGHAAQPYDNALHAAAQAAAFGPSDSFLPWPYPPYFLGVAAFLALFPYLWALALWQGATVALYGAAVLKSGRPSGLSRMAMLGVALAFPAVTINILHGHNGFLTAGLLAFGALLLPKRPLVAGAMFGLLAYKPQFALAIPVALLAGGFWRAALSACATVAFATLATIAVFGLAPWRAFFESLVFTRRVVLEQGGAVFGKLQSAFAATRLVGGSIELAYGAQAIVTGAVLIGLAWIWRRDADHRLKAASLMVATVLTTPYAMDYDMVILAIAIALMVGHGAERAFGPFGKTLLACLWVMPLFARPVAMGFAVPLGMISMLILFWYVVGRAAEGSSRLVRCADITCESAEVAWLLGPTSAK